MIRDGPLRDCNGSGTFCNQDEEGVIHCIPISTLTDCDCFNDVSSYYYIPSQFKIELLDAEMKRIKIINIQDNSYAILVSKLEVLNFEVKRPKEICSNHSN